MSLNPDVLVANLGFESVFSFWDFDAVPSQDPSVNIAGMVFAFWHYITNQVSADRFVCMFATTTLVASYLLKTQDIILVISISSRAAIFVIEDIMSSMDFMAFMITRNRLESWYLRDSITLRR